MKISTRRSANGSKRLMSKEFEGIPEKEFELIQTFLKGFCLASDSGSKKD